VSAESGRPPVGSVAEEAAKLLHALQGWGEQTGAEYGEATASAAAEAARRLRDVDDHLATGGRDCTFCPICQVISTVRGTSPEVKQHLASAATSLMQAAAALLATPVPDQPTGRHGAPVEKIEVSDDEREDD
jgi:hypothetical protein